MTTETGREFDLDNNNVEQITMIMVCDHPGEYGINRVDQSMMPQKPFGATTPICYHEAYKDANRARQDG